MNPTIYLARIAAKPNHISAHTTYEAAVEAVLRAGARLYSARFGYTPEDLLPFAPRAAAVYGLTAAAALELAADRLYGSGGWLAVVEELEVELAAAEDDAAVAEHEARAEDRDAEAAGLQY